MKMYLAVIIACLLMSCKLIKPGTDTQITEATNVKYVPVDVQVKGAAVGTSLNIDSLVKVAVLKRTAYIKDSLDAVMAGKPIPPPPTTDKKTFTDPQTKAELSYWIDQYGQLQISCESKDQTINLLVAEVTRLSKEVTKKTEIVKETPKWNWVLITGLSVLLIISVLINVFIKNR